MPRKKKCEIFLNFSSTKNWSLSLYNNSQAQVHHYTCTHHHVRVYLLYSYSSFFFGKKWKIFFCWDIWNGRVRRQKKNLCKIWYRKKIVCGGWNSCDSHSLTHSHPPSAFNSLQKLFFGNHWKTREKRILMRHTHNTHTIIKTRRPKAAFFSGVIWGLCQYFSLTHFYVKFLCLYTAKLNIFE